MGEMPPMPLLRTPTHIYPIPGIFSLPPPPPAREENSLIGGPQGMAWRDLVPLG